MAEQISIEGDLRQTSLHEILQRLSWMRATGILTVQGEEDIVAISCLKGEIVAADALNQTLEEGLGDILVRLNIVPAEEFAAAVRDHQGGGSGSLPEMIVQRGLATREQVLGALRRQTYRLMTQVLTWRNGEFRFYSGDEVSYEDGVPPLSLEELSMRALEDLGERSGLPGEVPKLDVLYRAVPPRGPLKVLGRDGDGSDGGLWVSELQAAFLHHLDGHKRVDVVARSLGVGRFQTLFCLHQLLRKDLLEISTGSAVASPPGADHGFDSPPTMRAPAAPSVSVLDTTSALTGDFSTSTPATGPIDLSGPSQEIGEGLHAAPAPAPTVALNPWFGPGLAAFLVMTLIFLLFDRPGWILLPFPGQEIQRQTLEQNLRRSLFEKIDRSARTYFLLEHHFPESLEDLVDKGYLPGRDRRDPTGMEVRYSSDGLTYRAEVLVDGEEVEGFGAARRINGDFLLDPQFIESQAEPLIQLLDD